MGGHALSQVSVRLAAINYTRLAEDCIAQLKARFPDNRIEMVEAYRDKPDFGDLDLLIESTGFDPHQAAAALNAMEIVRNGPVTSIGIPVRPDLPATEGNLFQVDLIKVPLDEFDASRAYFAWNDLGNLCGRLAHSMGLKLGHDGLSYTWRHGDHVFASIDLLKHWRDILPVLGLSYERWEQGFDSLEDIFKFVVSSPYFNRDIFLLHNRNNTTRVRDAKRKTYMEFLLWLEAQPALPGRCRLIRAWKTRWTGWLICLRLSLALRLSMMQFCLNSAGLTGSSKSLTESA